MKPGKPWLWGSYTDVQVVSKDLVVIFNVILRSAHLVIARNSGSSAALWGRAQSQGLTLSGQRTSESGGKTWSVALPTARVYLENPLGRFLQPRPGSHFCGCIRSPEKGQPMLRASRCAGDDNLVV